MKHIEKRKRESKHYLTLYDTFKPGDRVKRSCMDKYGKSEEYEGIVMSIDKNNMKIFWDTLNRKYRPKEIDENFTNCSVDEIFEGSEKYTPFKREKRNLRNILKVH